MKCPQELIESPTCSCCCGCNAAIDPQQYVCDDCVDEEHELVLFDPCEQCGAAEMTTYRDGQAVCDECDHD